MHAIQRRTHFFETRSVLLFAALSLGAVTASQAQTQPGTQAGASFGPGSSASTVAPKFTIGPAEAAPTTAKAAFDKADANRDGKLTAQEAATLPAMGNRFKQLDADKNGFLSPAEFAQSAAS
ncbi:MAG: EF-hand domain-containing protein [Simplicispira sp.]|nr:EF-hand domain-containing protein [Simplicispira sp.]